jgi:glycosyltransferase involved in cell wall biosynthesis
MMLASVEGFVERGWRVVVTLPETGPLIAEVEARGGTVQICPTPVVRKSHLSPRGALALAALTLRSVRAGRRLLRDAGPDVVYVSTLVVPLWLLLARFQRRPIVCHVHEAESSAPRVLRRALAAPLRLADRLLVNSQFAADVLTDTNPRLGARLELVYNGVAGPDELVPARPSLDPPLRLLFLGRLSERKGVLDAADAVAVLAARGVTAELDIVGDAFPGSEWIADELRSRATAAGIAGQVHLLGFRAPVWPHLAATDVLLVPSRLDEPFGNTVIEGALSGRPVVATRTGGLREAVAGLQAARTVPPGSPDAIADAVGEIADRWDDMRAAAMADAGRVAQRHAPAGYRAAVAGAVEALVRRPGRH